jgi:hypothetical protein
VNSKLSTDRILKMRRDLGIPFDPLEQVRRIREQMGLNNPHPETRLRRSTERTLL